MVNKNISQMMQDFITALMVQLNGDLIPLSCHPVFC